MTESNDAAHLIFTQPSREFTGNYCIDDTLLYDHGQREFDHYRGDPSVPLQMDFFVPEDSVAPVSLAAVGGGGEG